MNTTPLFRSSQTDSITIGRNPVLTYRIVTGIAAREAKTARRRALIKRILSFGFIVPSIAP